MNLPYRSFKIGNGIVRTRRHSGPICYFNATHGFRTRALVVKGTCGPTDLACFGLRTSVGLLPGSIEGVSPSSASLSAVSSISDSVSCSNSLILWFSYSFGITSLAGIGIYMASKYLRASEHFELSARGLVSFRSVPGSLRVSLE